MKPSNEATGAGVRALDYGRNHHAEKVAFLKAFDAECKEKGIPVFLHCWNKYIQGWLEDDTGHRWFCVAPPKYSPQYYALVDCWWNRGALGGKP